MRVLSKSLQWIFRFYSITLHIDCSWLLVPEGWGNMKLGEWNMKCFLHVGVFYYYYYYAHSEQNIRLSWLSLLHFFISVTMKLILVEFCTQKLLGKFSVCSYLTLSKMFYSVMLLVTEIVQHWWWMSEWMNMECFWNDTDRGKLMYLKKNLPQCSFRLQHNWSFNRIMPDSIRYM